MEREQERANEIRKDDSEPVCVLCSNVPYKDSNACKSCLSDIPY